MLSTDKSVIPVCKPKLPSYKEIIPYLKKIDNNRFYSNFGPLSNSLEERISQRLGYSKNVVALSSSGTQALETALKMWDFPAGSKIICPSWTFIASAQAILNAGFVPEFVDVEIENWWLDISLVKNSIINDKSIKGVMIVAPFGNIPNIQEWEELSQDFNVKIIMDAAAASIDDLQVSKIIPTMLSLHATKTLTAGEGGLIIFDNDDYIYAFKQKINFGLGQSEIHLQGTNAKISEYHAAVCHAALDNWHENSNIFMNNCSRYKSNLCGTNIKFLPGFGLTRFNATCIIISPHNINDYLLSNRIETRKWWRYGCHREPLFSALSDDLPNTCKLSEQYLGLPNFLDIGTSNIDFISEKIINYLKDFT